MTQGGAERAEKRRQFGDNVRRYRELREMSQEDLAKAMTGRGWQWHQSTVYKIERGDMRKTEGTEVHDLAEVLRVSIDRLFWAGAEATEIALVDRAIASLRKAHAEAALAIARLDAARRGSAKTLKDRRDSEYERVRQTCGDLEAELETATLDTAIRRAVDILEGDR